MKWIFFIAAILSAGSSMGQSDTLIRLGGNKMAIIYKQESANDITYSLAANPNILISISKNEVEWVYLKNGKHTQYTKTVLSMYGDTDWQKITVTSDSRQISNLYKLSSQTAKSVTKFQTKKQAYDAAVVSLQRKAAEQKGSLVLIENVTYLGGYNDPQTCSIEGSVWGPTRPRK